MVNQALKRSWLVPAVFAAAVCFTHIHQGTIAVDAIRYSAIAEYILRSGDWLHLYDRLTDSPYANKPPLLFWSLAATFDTVGFSTFWAKFPAVAFTFAALLLIWRLGVLLFGEGAGLWALLLLALNRSFFRDLVELGFDGMAVCGALLCMLAAVHFFRPEARRRRVWLPFGLGLLLLLQSKPPYAALAAMPILAGVIFDGRLREVLKQRGFWLSVAMPLTISAAWFAVSGGRYLESAVDNQLAEPLRYSGSYLKNIALWLQSFAVDFAPASIIGVWALLAEWKRERLAGSRLSPLFVVLSCWLLMSLPIVLLVAQRARYLWVPMLAAVLLAAGLLDRVFKFSPPVLRRGLLLLAGLSAVLVLLFGVRVHRYHPLIEMMEEMHPDERTRLCFCVDGDMEHRHERMAKYSELLLLLEYELEAEVWNSAELPPDAGRRCLLLAEENCLAALTRARVPHEFVRRSKRAALLRIRESSP